MAKKKIKKDSMSLIKKGISLVAAAVTFVFMFLEMLAVSTRGSLFGKEGDIASEGVKYFDVLFGDEAIYESIRENLSLTTIILWVVFVMAILAVAFCVISFLVKKGAKFSKLGSGLLFVAMLLLFVVNFDKASFSLGGLASSETWISNITVLYFVSLVFSGAGFVSALSLKK